MRFPSTSIKIVFQSLVDQSNFSSYQQSFVNDSVASKVKHEPTNAQQTETNASTVATLTSPQPTVFNRKNIPLALSPASKEARG